MTRRTQSVLIVLAGLGLCLFSLTGLGSFDAPRAAAAALQATETPASAAPATASPSGSQPTPEATRRPNLSISNQYCLDCHGAPGQTFTLENGDVLDLFVDPTWHQNSVHGEMGYACVQCHSDVGEYPHPAWQAADRRDATIKLTQQCARCHEQQAKLEADGVHANAQRQGIREAAVCVDCHTAHEVRRLTDPATHQLLPETRQWIPERCALCHNAIYQKYKDSVHGSALSEGNPDVPTCIDCHGVHNIENPTTAYFRLRSPDLCAKCHANKDLMNKYGINTNVLNSYVADFHGTTVAIFEKVAPDAPVNKAVCYDCHGVHDISRVDDPQTGLQMQQNILVRCKACHPDANANFPSAWMSHYNPSPEHNPWVYYVNLFYAFFIPGVLGSMAVLVVLDAGRLAVNRRKRHPAAPAAPEGTDISAPAEASAPVDVFAAPEEPAIPDVVEEAPAEPQAGAVEAQPDAGDQQPPATQAPAEADLDDSVETDQSHSSDTLDTDSEAQHE